MNKSEKEWMYKQILKESELRQKHAKKETITEKDIQEMINIERHVKIEGNVNE
jgi:histone H3/H4